MPRRTPDGPPRDCRPEAEWEFAARGGLERKPYAWGDQFQPDGRWMANIWQGRFPVKDDAEDGFAGIAPTAKFPPNGFGLFDMAGNVWEWCSDWYRPDTYAQLAKAGPVARNPKGPPTGYDPSEPARPSESIVEGRSSAPTSIAPAT